MMLRSSRTTANQVARLYRAQSRTFSAPPAAATSATTVADDGVPPLKIIPSLPFLGSLLPIHSGVPKLQEDNLIQSFRDINKFGGPFFRMGMPGFGQGTHGTLYVIRDPQEMLRVLKQEGAHPSGVVEKEWPMVKWIERRQWSGLGLLGRGEEWKRIRNFVQKDILSPAAAREYLPGILQGAAFASAKAGELQGNDIMKYLNFAAFDMFSFILFGDGKKGMSDEDYEMFCASAVDALDNLFNIMRSPVQIVAGQVLGMETPWAKTFYGNMDTVDEIARRRLEVFLEKVENGTLSEEGKASYFGKLVSRQRSEENDVSHQELMENAITFMLASVDTTAAKTAWNVMQLALNPDIQESLHQQLVQAALEEGQEENNITLTSTMLDKSKIPLLHAFVRETHRCTPPLGSDLIKEVSVDTVVHGETLPAGSNVMFDPLTAVMDPELVDEPLEFRPERWFSDAVESRKGTPQAMIDHPFFAGPFSQGARRCPGSRVAYLEVQAMLAQLILDYRIEGPTDMHWQDTRGILKLMFVPNFPKEVKFVPRH